MIKLLKEQPDINPYSQVGQHSDVQWATVAENAEGLYQTHPWFKCKDYLNEYVASGRTGKPYAAFGYKFDPAKDKHPVDGKFHVLIKSKNLEVIKQGVAKFLNPIEEEAGLMLTGFEDVEENVALIHADGIYIKEPLFVSAFALLVRNFFYLESVNAENLVEYCEAIAKLGVGNTGMADIQHKGLSVSLLKLLIINMHSLTTDDETFTKRMEDGNGEVYIHSHTGVQSTLNYMTDAYQSYLQDVPDSSTAKFVKGFYPHMNKMANLLQIGDAQ